MRRSILPALFLLIEFLAARPAGAQPQAEYVLPLEGAIQFDGRVDDAAWSRIPPLPMTTYEPTFGGDPTERTEIRVGYDDDFVYVGGAFFDSDPAGIRANSLYRDQVNDSDVFQLILDTFNDNENALIFWTTPSGVRGDMAISGDGGTHNLSWNTYWDVQTFQDDRGWFAEIRIPFSSLGFQSAGGRISMGLIVSRRIARKNEEHVFPAIANSWPVATPSRARDVTLNGVHVRKPVYVTPYAIGGMGSAGEMNVAQSGYRRQREFTRDIGLDVKYSVTSNVTVDATVNTDFAQVEADDQQVNLTRYSLFFPEKRQFFQERAGLFQFTTSNERLFHSRTIGIRDGEAIPILGGVRLVGRHGKWDVGVLDMQTARAGSIPSENFGVARIRRGVFNDNSTAGAIATSRVGLDGHYNVAYGLDGVFRLFGHEYLGLNWAQTFESGLIDSDEFQLARAGLFEASWARRELDGWSYQSSLTWSGEDFRPGMGFVRRRNYTELNGLLHLNRFPGAYSPFQRTMFVHLDGYATFRNEDGSLESASARYLPMVWFKNGSVAMLSSRIEVEDLRSPVAFVNESTVSPGRYVFGEASASYTTSTRSRFRARIQAGAGTFYDGDRLSVGFQPEWNPSPHFQLSGSYALTSVRFDDRNEGFDAQLLGLRIQTAIDRHASANAFVQYSSAAARATVNLRVRYSFREGSDLWLVYNEGLNTDRAGVEPFLPLSDERTLLLKYTYTFDLLND